MNAKIWAVIFAALLIAPLAYPVYILVSGQPWGAIIYEGTPWQREQTMMLWFAPAWVAWCFVWLFIFWGKLAIEEKRSGQ